MIDRREWLLLLLALKDAGEPLDLHRLQTGMFLLSDHLPHASAYPTVGGDWSEFDLAIEEDLASLEQGGQVTRDEQLGPIWAEFLVTDAGVQRAKQLVSAMNRAERPALRELAHIKRDVLSLSFRDLVDQLRRDHPELARRSVLG